MRNLRITFQGYKCGVKARAGALELALFSNMFTDATRVLC